MALRLLLLASLFAGCVFRTEVPLDGGVSRITCADPSECPRGLSCSAKLGVCYDPTSVTVDGGLSSLPCESRFDCPRPLTCATDFGFCVQADEVMVDGDGFTSLTCGSRAGCPPPLSCAINLGRCVVSAQVRTDGGVSALPCNTNSDCVGSLVCATGLRRCADPEGVVTDGGVSALPCTNTSDCIGSLVCATGLQRCADPSGIGTDGGISGLPCTSTSDCIGSLVCATGLQRCADPSGIGTDGGISALPCTTTSDCIGSLVCATGLGRCANPAAIATDAGISSLPCTSTSDCIGTLVCARGLGFCTDLSRLPIDDAGVSQVPCQFSDDCPSPLACSSRASRCVDTSRVQLPVILQARLVDGAGQVVTRRSGVAPFDTGEVLVDLQLPPVALNARFRTTDSTCVATTPTNWKCPITFSGPSGSEVITLVASDVRGPAITERISVLIDADPPRVVAGTETLAIVPAPGNLLTQLGPSFAPTALRQDSVARVSLLLDDPNTTSAQVYFGTSTTQLPFTRRVGQSFVFEGQLPATLPEGEVLLQVTAIDDLGNRLARQPLVVEPRLRRDVTPPPAPDVTTNNGVVLERVPFGDGTRTGAFVRMALSPGSGFLVFREAPGTPVVLTLRPTGGPIAGQVSTIDQEQLLAQAVDEAGNVSAEVQVRRFRLFVNPGRTANFTHVATTADLSTPARHELPVPMPQLEAADGLTVSAAPQPRWEPLHDGLDAGIGFVDAVSLIEDTPRRRLLRVLADSLGSPRVVADLANGHRVVTNLVLPSARYVSACHTTRRTCLLVGNPLFPSPGLNPVLWLLDDQGVRQLRPLTGTSGMPVTPATITFDARREVFLLAQGNQLVTLDESGSPVSTGPSDCMSSPMTCHVVATPRGLLSAQSSQFILRERDGGSAQVTGISSNVGPFSRLFLDRSSLGVVVSDSHVRLVQLDGGTSVLATCPGSGPSGCVAAWDPLARVLATMDERFPGTFGDAGSLDPSPFEGEVDSSAWVIAEPNGFLFPSRNLRYDERTGWTRPNLFPSMCSASTSSIAPLGVRVDGGWVSPCGRLNSLTGPETPVPNFPSQGWVATLGNQFVFSNSLWRDGVTTTVNGVPSNSVGIPPNRLFVSPVTVYEIGPDAGVQPTSFTFQGTVPPLPSMVPFMPTTTPSSPPSPFDGWLWGNQGPFQTNPVLLRLTFQPFFTLESTVTTPLAPAGLPVVRATPVVIERAGGRFLLFGGATGTPPNTRPVTDVWAFHTASRPTVHWSVDTSRFNVPLDGVVNVQVSTELSGIPFRIPRAEVLAWDAWRASWRVLAALDGGTSGSGNFVPAAATFDVAVSGLPTTGVPLSVDRLEAVIDYVK